MVSITIPKEWVAQSALKKYNQGKTLWGYFHYYLRITGAPICLYLILYEKPENFMDIAPALFITVIVSVLFSFYRDYSWRSGVNKSSVGYSYVATLDGEGVCSNYIINPVNIKWSHYKSAKVINNRLELVDVEGGMTFVPVNDETLDAVKFTQHQIALVNNTSKDLIETKE